MARITWQNVTAPDVSGAASATLAAGRMFGDAFSGVADALGRVRERRNTELSNAALGEALRVTSPGDWDRVMQQQGLAAFGIDPKNMTPELARFLSGRRGGLLNEEGTSIGNADRQLRSDWFGKTSAYDFERTKTEDALKDQTRETTLQGQLLAQQLAETLGSPEEAKRTILNGNYSPALESAAMTALGGMGDAFSPLASDLSAVRSQPEVKRATTDLTNKQNDLNRRMSTDVDVQLFNEANKASTEFSSPTEGLIQAARSRADGVNADEQIVNYDAGEINDLFNRLSNDYSQVPQSVIAQVMKANMREAGWLWGKGTLNYNTKAIENRLAGLNDPKRRAELQAASNAFAAEQQLLDEQKAFLERGVNQQALGRSRGNGDNTDWLKTFAAPDVQAGGGAATVRGQGSPAPTPASAPAPAPTAPAPQAAPVPAPAPVPGTPRYDAPIGPLQDRPANILAPRAEPTLVQGASSPALASAAKELGISDNAIRKGDKAVEAVKTGLDPDTGEPLNLIEIEKFRREAAAYYKKVNDKARNTWPGRRPPNIDAVANSGFGDFFGR